VSRRRKYRGNNGPRFIQLFHYVKRSEAYHSLSPDARAFLLELIDRHTGTNNGFIRFGVREAMYELGIKSMGRTSAIMREVDDAGLARPTQVGAWRGKKPTEMAADVASLSKDRRSPGAVKQMEVPEALP
jgi:hypothetical protein